MVRAVMVVLGAVLVAVQSYALLYLAYLWVPAIAAVVGRRRGAGRTATPGDVIHRGVERSFAILVSAHNEASVVGSLLQSLANQAYPVDKRRIYVVANTCTDATPAVVRSSGVATCHERVGGGLATKGAALSWLWGRIAGDVADVDCVLILDADNVVPPGYLSEMNRAFDEGFRVVQSARCAKNAEDSWTSELDAISEALWNRLDQAGRMRLGLSATIAGSGMAFERQLFAWLVDEGGPGLLEDIEWQARLMLAGVRVGFAERARVYDEKTSRPGQLGRQRKRWVAGVAVAARRYAWPLLKSGLRSGDVGQLVAAFGVSKPPRSLLPVAAGALALGARRFPATAWLLPWQLWTSALASAGGYVLLGMALDGARPRSYLALLAAPAFAAGMVGVSLVGALQASKQRWIPTTHGRNVVIDELRVK
jgi:cellulose synthase/poly-beta-1,6-N-acetylglucosamine synthase-like glycosyltransferase